MDKQIKKAYEQSEKKKELWKIEGEEEAVRKSTAQIKAERHQIEAQMGKSGAKQFIKDALGKAGRKIVTIRPDEEAVQTLYASGADLKNMSHPNRLRKL